MGKATEHLLGKGISPEPLNDDRLGRVLDKLYQKGLTQVFVTVALEAARKFGVKMDSLHLDASSFHVDGDYPNQSEDEAQETEAIHITYGYSRDRRPDLKQFMMDLMCTCDGDIPLYLRVGSGNESDSAMFATLITDFKQQWQIDPLFVADAALYTEENLQQIKRLHWVSRVPATLNSAKQLLNNIHHDAMVSSSLPGYQFASCCSSYGGIQQRWLVVESQARRESDLKQLEKRLDKQLIKAKAELQQLSQTRFACAKDALLAAERLNSQLPLHQLADITIVERIQHQGRGRPRKNAQMNKHYQLGATLVPKTTAIELELQRAGRFI